MSDQDKPSYLTEEYVSRLNDIGELLKAGDNEGADKLVSELTILRESSLFHELGKLTREIHESINAFTDDQRVVELAEDEIPDAKERLNLIITKTHQAAHRTMNDAEEAMEVIDNFRQQSNGIHERWIKFRTRELSKEDFLVLSDEMDKFFGSIDSETDKVKSITTDIMMAQDYQDLTGQMIKQVIDMVQEVEEKLVSLVAITGAKLKGNEEVDGTKAQGPQLPSAQAADDVAANQDDVDDLLASLGF